MRQFITDVVKGLTSLIYPTQCLGCYKGGSSLCDDCALYWTYQPSIVQKIPFPIYAIAPYSIEVSRVVLLAKENGNVQAQSMLATAIAQLLASATPQNFKECFLVPIPSKRSSIRRRGEKFLIPILSEVTKIMSSKSETHYSVAEILEIQRSVRDQSGLTSKERVANMKSAYRVKLPVESEKNFGKSGHHCRRCNNYGKHHGKRLSSPQREESDSHCRSGCMCITCAHTNTIGRS